MNTHSDNRLLDILRLTLSEAAPAAPSPALLATVRREAARHARRKGARRTAFLAAALAAAAALALAIFSPGTLPVHHSADPAALAAADDALRLLLFDATEARAAVASDAVQSDDSTDAAETEVEPSSDNDSLALALLAWQEEPLQGLFESQSAVF